MQTTTKNEIIEEVKKSVERHHCSKQRYQQLKMSLSKADSLLTGDALLDYWCTLDDPDTQFEAQQFVASLLFALNPCTSVTLSRILRRLSNWNLSVEEFPWYLATQFGEEQVLLELRILEDSLRDIAYARAAETVRRWLQADYTTIRSRY
jgi:hypothetical protein